MHGIARLAKISMKAALSEQLRAPSGLQSSCHRGFDLVVCRTQPQRLDSGTKSGVTASCPCELFIESVQNMSKLCVKGVSSVNIQQGLNSYATLGAGPLKNRTRVQLTARNLFTRLCIPRLSTLNAVPVWWKVTKCTALGNKVIAVSCILLL